jgi:hypothetical protein
MAKHTNRIKQFMHCSKCIEEIPDGISPRDFLRIEMGFTKEGIQIWCVRHEENIADFDLMGNQIGYVEV